MRTDSLAVRPCAASEGASDTEIVGYELILSCGACGGPLRHLATGTVVAGRELHASSKCASCGAQWTAEVRLSLERLPAGENR